MVSSPLTQSEIRLAEPIAALCLATDLATGQPLEHGFRRALLGVWLGEELGLSRHELSNVYFVALLGTVGCTIEGAAFARFFKDDIAFGEQIVLRDPTRPIEMAAFFLRKIGEGDPPSRRARKVLSAALLGPTESQIICRDVALQVGEMLELGPEIRQAVGQCHEHWDGRGGPRRLKGEELSLAARIFRIAHDAEIFNRVGGGEAAVGVIRQRAGKVYDPRIADRFCEVAGHLLSRLESETTWDEVLATEPAPVRLLSLQEFDSMAQTVANFVDMRSAYTLGHSPRVAAVAEIAARALGLSDAEATALRHAGLLHDLGRAGVPVAVWNKREPLTASEWDRMKRHPSFTELVLARSSALGHLGILAGLHHERLDGSGYRGVPASFLSVAAQVLAVADAYQTKLESRPHREAMTPDVAAEEVQRQANQGRFDSEVVAAILAAAGHQAPASKKREWPAGLSDREIDVIRLAVRGLSNRQIAETLFLSPKTVGHHIEHIYNKIGVSTRVGATLFALNHDLVQKAAGADAS